jgi:hypothetical protein
MQTQVYHIQTGENQRQKETRGKPGMGWEGREKNITPLRA